MGVLAAAVVASDLSSVVVVVFVESFSCHPRRGVDPKRVVVTSLLVVHSIATIPAAAGVSGGMKKVR